MLVKLEFPHELYICAFSVAGIRDFVVRNFHENLKEVNRERKKERERKLFQNIERTLEFTYVEYVWLA